MKQTYKMLEADTSFEDWFPRTEHMKTIDRKNHLALAKFDKPYNLCYTYQQNWIDLMVLKTVSGDN